METPTPMSFPDIQAKMQIPKSRASRDYGFRNADDIYTTFKQLDSGWSLKAPTTVVEIGGVLFWRCKATIRAGEQRESSTAYVHVTPPPLNRNGGPMMSQAQWDGACQSYVRKYAMEGLFAIGSVDIDSYPVPQRAVNSAQLPPELDWEAVLFEARTATNVDEWRALWKQYRIAALDGVRNQRLSEIYAEIYQIGETLAQQAVKS